MTGPRPVAKGKFLFVGDKKLYVRGVTYGPFRPDEDGNEYRSLEAVERDFALMRANYINALRTYTVPPRWLLDAAGRHGLRVMVGLPWEHHVARLHDRKFIRSVEERVRGGVRQCAGHPAILCYTIGNEIPASIVRWHGRRQVERQLERLYRSAKEEDPGGLVTYVNYPSTEYLRLPFIDAVCFNVYLESRERLRAYLARLQNLAGERPLIMAEIGLDSLRHGEAAQARVLDWQVRTAFETGCAGAFMFSWTDEWYRGGFDIEDWAFGLTDRQRRPKRALWAVRKVFAEVPVPLDQPPRISVVVCTYNRGRMIRDCLEGLRKLEYPDYEVIVVDDGSTDDTAAIAAEYDVRLIRTENRGLSSARNTGMEAATGEIVAYIDDDAWPDSHWLSYLASSFMNSSHAGIGGPNIAPPCGRIIAECVANAPGGPNHVLLSDQEAEHIPGCNMAFRKSALQAVGGFDPQFRIAGDDVDLCWKLQDKGWTLGFNPAAMVWHHRRPSIRAFWRQQRGYGKAEAMLERKWPAKFNGAGHLKWAGRVYGKGLPKRLEWCRARIYHGMWGCAPFQSLYQPAPTLLGSLPLMPEWYLVVLVLTSLSVLGALWKPLLLTVPLLLAAVGVPLVQAALSAAQVSFTGAPRPAAERMTLFILTALLHLIQPVARLWGRAAHGLTPWRLGGGPGLSLPWRRLSTIWSERWRAAEEWLRSLETTLRANQGGVREGGDFDPWDLEIAGGLLGAVRVRMAIEEHGAGRQLARFFTWPKFSTAGICLILILFALLGWAAADGAWLVASALGTAGAFLALRTLKECGAAMHRVIRAFDALSSNGFRPFAVRKVADPGTGLGRRDPRRVPLSPNRRAHGTAGRW
ncbi:MAG: glycosyltransferase [Candidatus Tectomicrobia bacterium]|nr:glycosyltransferase [Candidatus Tectomicrobia bacterium]